MGIMQIQAYTSDLEHSSFQGGLKDDRIVSQIESLHSLDKYQCRGVKMSRFKH